MNKNHHPYLVKRNKISSQQRRPRIKQHRQRILLCLVKQLLVGRVDAVEDGRLDVRAALDAPGRAYYDVLGVQRLNEEYSSESEYVFFQRLSGLYV